jgi:thioredoxin 1
MKIVLAILLSVFSVSAFAENTIMRFTASWCGPCVRMSPNFKEATSKRKDLTIKVFDADMDEKVFNENKVDGIPTLIFLKDGKELGRTTGYMDTDEITATINHYFGK